MKVRGFWSVIIYILVGVAEDTGVYFAGPKANIGTKMKPRKSRPKV